MSLVTRITDLVVAVREKINTMMPRLMPAGGTVGQVITKTGTADFTMSWGTPVATITYGDKGDITVGNGGTTWTINDSPKYGLPAAMRQGTFFN